jgi:hypothetical protein
LAISMQATPARVSEQATWAMLFGSIRVVLRLGRPRMAGSAVSSAPSIQAG